MSIGKNLEKIMSKLADEKDDWSNDEDNWDDWGDAEDIIPETSAETTKGSAATAAVTSKDYTSAIEISNSNKNEPKNSNEVRSSKQPQSQSSIPDETANNKSWESVWKPWGGVVSSVFSTATEGLGNITSSVSHGLNNVIGVPDPEEMARINVAKANEAVTSKTQPDEVEKTEVAKANELDTKLQDQQHGTPAFGLSLVSGVTTLGSKVLNTGLDTLEGIGKKTMNILQENDPLLMNKRKMLGLETEKPNLSEILKEAKKESDQLENTLKELKLEKSKELLRFETLFENNCGLVHLEALEILSKESTIRLQSLLSSVSGNALAELQETLNEVKELLELEDLEGDSEGDYDSEELNDKLVGAIEDAELQIKFDDIQKIWADARDWLNVAAAEADVQEKFAKGITTLAETCALEINKLHKIAELLLVKEHHSTANEVDSIVQLCKHFSIHLNGLTNQFASTLDGSQSDEAKDRVNTLFAELCLATKEIEKAYKLFLPILQIGAV